MKDEEYRGLSREEMEAYSNIDTAVVPEGAKRDGDVVHKVMASTFLFMFAALLISGAAAVYAATDGFLLTLLENPNLLYGLLFGELAIVFIANATLKRGAVIPSALLFVAYAVINGLTLSTVFFLYELGSISTIFMLTAGMFAILAVFGIATKKDLTSVGTIGMIGLLGVIVLSVINMFLLKSSGMDLLLSIVGLAVFVGLTAYDAQRIKRLANENTGVSISALALMGALMLYLDFINIFLRLLRLFGKRR